MKIKHSFDVIFRKFFLSMNFNDNLSLPDSTKYIDYEIEIKILSISLRNMAGNFDSESSRSSHIPSTTYCIRILRFPNTFF